LKHADGDGRVAAAILVALSDVEASTYLPGSTGFDPIPLQKLPFRSVVVASTDDPFVALERAEFFADPGEAASSQLPTPDTSIPPPATDLGGRVRDGSRNFVIFAIN